MASKPLMSKKDQKKTGRMIRMISREGRASGNRSLKQSFSGFPSETSAFNVTGISRARRLGFVLTATMIIRGFVCTRISTNAGIASGRRHPLPVLIVTALCVSGKVRQVLIPLVSIFSQGFRADRLTINHKETEALKNFGYFLFKFINKQAPPYRGWCTWHASKGRFEQRLKIARPSTFFLQVTTSFFVSREKCPKPANAAPDSVVTLCRTFPLRLSRFVPHYREKSRIIWCAHKTNGSCFVYFFLLLKEPCHNFSTIWQQCKEGSYPLQENVAKSNLTILYFYANLTADLTLATKTQQKKEKLLEN